MTPEEREALKAEIRHDILQELELVLTSKPVYQNSLMGYQEEHSIQLKWGDLVLSEVTLPLTEIPE